MDQEKSTARTTDAGDSSTRKPLPQCRVHEKNENGVIVIDGSFSHSDGWCEVTVGWYDDQYSDGRGCWIAECSTQRGCMADSEVSQMHALAELVRSLAAVCHMYERREAELHRAIYNSSDALAKELREAEANLHAVQKYITTHVEPSETENWDAGLEPLWRAERAVEAFAARLAVDCELAVDPSWSTPKRTAFNVAEELKE